MYHIRCDNCDELYIREMGRFLKSRFLENKSSSSVNSEVSRHKSCDQPDHSITLDYVKILEVELKWFKRGVRESIQIRIDNTTLNKEAGRYNLHLV